MKSKNNSFFRGALVLTALLGLFGTGACGGSGVETAPGEELPSAPVLGEVVPKAFNLGSSPVDIDIVDKPGLENIAFITTSATAGVVLALDLNSNPISLSSSIVGLPTLPSSSDIGYPNNLEVIDAQHALLLTSNFPTGGKIVFFNPTTGSVYQLLDLGETLNLSTALQKRNADGFLTSISGEFNPSFPASMGIVGSRLAVSFSNLSYEQNGISAVQGLIRFFDIQNETLIPRSYVATTGFNTTGITVLKNGKLLVTDSGVLKFTDNNQTPLTNAHANIIDPFTFTLETVLNLGQTAPAYRQWALSSDGSKAYIGSASGGFVIGINLIGNPSVIYGLSNPLVVTSALLDTDFLDDVVMSRDGMALFVASFNTNSVYTLDLTETPPTLSNNVINLSLNEDPQIRSGAGPMALRPGIPGLDFTGFDFYVLTATPGTLAAVKTY